MRIQLTAVDAATGARVDVALDVSPADPVDDVEHALTGVLPRGGTGLWLGASPLDGAHSVLAAGVRSGCELWLGGPDPATVATGERDGPVQLRVVSGPDAGAVHQLPYGETVVGRAPTAGVQLTDDEASHRHLLVTVSQAGAVVTDLGSTNGVLLDGSPLTVPCPAGPRTLLTVGRNLLTITPYDVPDAAVTPSPDLSLDVNRPPRLLPAEPITTVELPSEPPVTAPRKLPWLPLALPVLLGVVMAVVSSPLFLLFTLMSPLVAVSTFLTDKRSGRAAAVTATKQYAAAG